MQGKTVWAKPLGVLQANVAKNRPALVPLSHWLGAAYGKQPQNKCSDGVQCLQLVHYMPWNLLLCKARSHGCHTRSSTLGYAPNKSLTFLSIQCGYAANPQKCLHSSPTLIIKCMAQDLDNLN